MTRKKSLEDILADYTEDLMAERRPRLAEDIAAQDEEERSQLMAMLPLVRDLKAAHREAPPLRGEFVQRLDAFVSEEITRQGSPASHEARALASPGGDFRSIATRRPLLDRILQMSRSSLEAIRDPAAGIRWRFLGAAVVVLLLGLQVVLYMQVRRLEQQNQALVAQLGQLTTSGSLIPLGLPRDQAARQERGGGTEAPKSLEDLFAGVELRVRIEHRIGELEKEIETKTGRDRQNTEALLRELRTLLRPTPKP